MKISVITATRDLSDVEALQRVWGSLEAQDLPDGWEFEWLLQVDGPLDYDALSVLNNTRALAGSTGRAGGAGAARNAALVRATGEWVCICDDDDTLPAGSLRRRIEALREHPSAVWVGGLVEQRDESGTHVLARQTTRSGLFTPHEALAELDGNSCFPILPMTLLARVDAVYAVGGWGAMPVGEDNILMSGLVALFPGVVLFEPLYCYQRREGSLTTSPLSLEVIATHRAWQLRRHLCSHEMLGARTLAPPHSVVVEPPGHRCSSICPKPCPHLRDG
jgi:glycosyltransferase involved in cell wall biosynthesis